MSAPLNLARQPFRNERLPTLVLAVACAALGVATVRHAFLARDLLPGRARDVESQVVRLEKEIAELRAESSQLLQLAGLARGAQEWAAVASLVDLRAFSWTGLLGALEAAVPPGVKLVSIAPQSKAGRTELVLRAVGRRSEDALLLLQSLQAHEGFEGAFLNGWTEGRDGIEHLLHGALRAEEEELTAPVGPFWRRRLLPAFLALLGVNLIAFAAWTGPRYWRQRNAATRAEAARAEAERQRASVRALRDRAAAIRGNGADVQRFYRSAGTEKADLLPTLEAIEDMARAPGLSPGARSFKREEIKDAKLERVAVTLPLEGSYPQLVGFLREVERSPRFLTVDSVTMAGDPDGTRHAPGGAQRVPAPHARGGGSPCDAERSRGITYLELVATAAIVMILASAILPMGRVAVRRQREIELRRELRKMREAINLYKQAVDQGQIGGTDVKLGSEGYPPDLETLVKGVNRVGAVDRKLKFLRRIPTDPMTTESEWGMRCYQDDPDSTSWCGENVWDVYSKSTAKGLDGTNYNTW